MWRWVHTDWSVWATISISAENYFVSLRQKKCMHNKAFTVEVQYLGVIFDISAYIVTV